MFDIESYNSLEEKKAFFHSNNKPIATEAEFESLWKLLEVHYNKNKKLIYRGTKNASYKLYSTAQRHWNENNLTEDGIGFDEFVNSEIKKAKITLGEKFQNYFLKQGIKGSNELALLSFMQHYSKPTPLLDFTTNPFVALYFAFEESNNPGKGGIHNYCSLYFVNCEYHLLQNYQHFFQERLTQRELLYNNISTVPMFHLYSEENKYQIINNPRIENQEGLFFINNHWRFPVEIHYKINTELAIKEKWIAQNSSSKLFVCYDMERNLKDYVLQKLDREKSINKQFIRATN